ncbi:hypothetical protein EYF80_027744 [Liparis tanakae]|uniref:Uncharacterized protein n=1 Tax=Liparis tanakae TaxID=230148 RepID=A0A4Z2H8A3_9TELE|nr:hypothetical protein EYF80_027744 [Liparis tanakae]
MVQFIMSSGKVKRGRMVNRRIQEAAVSVLIGRAGQPSRERTFSPTSPSPLSSNNHIRLAFSSTETVWSVGMQQISGGQAESPAQ